MKLFDNALMTVNLLGLLHVWGELVTAYHGVNLYGGDTAEIYAWNITKYRPMAHIEVGAAGVSEEANQEVALHAANALCSIVEEFCTQHECEAMIDGCSVSGWCLRNNRGEHRYDHRCHVRIIRKAGGT